MERGIFMYVLKQLRVGHGKGGAQDLVFFDHEMKGVMKLVRIQRTFHMNAQRDIEKDSLLVHLM